MILKIDTTNHDKISLGIFQKSKKIDKLIENNKKGSQVLLPSIVRILERNKKNLTDLSQIEVNTGPGSFTGTRIGVAVANALGFALSIPVNKKKGKIALPKYQKSKFD